jgi:hypothetical protein
MNAKFQLVRDGDHPGTGLPLYKVYDAAEYGNPAVSRPRPLGEVWAVGVPGVTGRPVPAGVRFQRSGSWQESPLLPAGAYGDAARAMIAQL